MKKIVLLIVMAISILSLLIYAQQDCTEKINQLNSKGQKEGLWKENISPYFKTETYYLNGVKSGLFNQYNKDDKLLISGEYCEGKQCGTWRFFDDGHLWFLFKDFSKNTFTITNEGDGKKYVPDYKCYSISYYLNGNIQDEGLLLWSEGESPESDFSVEYGEWKYYDETGTLIKTKEFK